MHRYLSTRTTRPWRPPNAVACSPPPSPRGGWLPERTTSSEYFLEEQDSGHSCKKSRRHIPPAWRRGHMWSGHRTDPQSRAKFWFSTGGAVCACPESQRPLAREPGVLEPAALSRRLLTTTPPPAFVFPLPPSPPHHSSPQSRPTIVRVTRHSRRK